MPDLRVEIAAGGARERAASHARPPSRLGSALALAPPVRSPPTHVNVTADHETRKKKKLQPYDTVTARARSTWHRLRRAPRRQTNMRERPFQALSRRVYVLMIVCNHLTLFAGAPAGGGVRSTLVARSEGIAALTPAPRTFTGTSSSKSVLLHHAVPSPPQPLPLSCRIC